MKAVVMAGGEGTRLRPLTSRRPKPLVPVMNRPIMEHIIVLLKQHGVTDIIVTLYYLADEISGYFGTGADWGVQIEYVVEESPLGTAGAVRQAAHLLGDEPFLIVSGDALTDIRLDRLIRYHHSKGAIVTLALAHVPNPREFGVVITDEDGRIQRFLEKPDWSNVFSDTVNTGMYVIDPEVFQLMEPGRVYDWSQDIFPQLLREGKPLYGYIMGEDEYWCDVGTIEQYREAHEQVLTGKVNLTLPAIEYAPGIWVEAGAQIHPEAEIHQPVYIGHQATIKRAARVGPFTVVGDNAIIEEGAVVEHSVLWDSVYVGINSYVASSVVGSHTTIKNEVRVMEGAVVGDRVTIGEGSTIRPHLKIWPDKFIEPGATVTMSLVWGKKWQGSLFRNLGVAGIVNVEITPEFATKLAASYGVLLRKGAAVLLSRDSHKSSRAIKHAVMSGLLSVGVNVFDLRSMPVPIARHHIRASGAAGGMNVRIAPYNPRLTLIEFFDKEGIYVSKSMERKIESVFFREDFVRTDIEEVGEIEFASRAIEQYQSDFFKHVDSRCLGEARYRVVLDFAFHRMASIFPTILGKMNCEVIALNAYADPDRAPHTEAQVQEHLRNLQQIVQSLRADVGVLFESDGERMRIVDAHGNILSDQRLLILYALAVARAYRRARIAVPVTASSVIEPLVTKHGGTVVRTKTDVRSLMGIAVSESEPVLMAGDGEGGFILPQFQPSFDALYGFVKLLELLSRAKTTLQDLAKQIPPFFLVRRSVQCPWELKGTVMRVMTRECRDDGKVELIDGIKIYQNGRWALILPDASEPLFHLYAEAENPEAAQGLLEHYRQRIEQMTGEAGR
ncbi:MAG: mannose-1-phosphate guanyltransferase [bacterium]|nr:mannose-1-phosphate guanyltransferase [bacterium]MCS7308937.1 mannose-1-phosphate guanyltransferase [Armatimonadota bacterium]